MGYGVGPHEYDCDCERCEGRRRVYKAAQQLKDARERVASGNYSFLDALIVESNREP
jgi:hypothetical protein